MGKQRQFGLSRTGTPTAKQRSDARGKVRAFLRRIEGGEEEESAAAREGFASYGAALAWTSELGLRNALANARVSRADVLAQEALRISDTDDSTKARLRVDTRKWLAKAYSPTVYGDKVTVERGEERVVHTHFVSLIGERKAVSHTNGETPAHNAGTLPTPTGDAPDAPLPESTQGTPTPPNSLPDRISEGEATDRRGAFTGDEERSATDRELESRDSGGSGPLAFLGDD